MHLRKMDKLSPPIQEVADLLSAEEVIAPSAPSYVELTRTWAAQKNLGPQLVAQPRNLKSLSRLIAILGTSELDFAIRCAGMGSASAKDVLVSMSAFDGFEFDRQSEIINIGAGQVWAEVDTKIERFAPGYASTALNATADSPL
jgi:FAD/FMN-containing dehydrogenase